MIERFTREEFELFLADLIQRPEFQPLFAQHVTVLPLGIMEGEYSYRIPLPNRGWLWIRSSISESGMADEAGADSIRVWVGDTMGNGLIPKRQNWVTRMPGWRERLRALILSQLEEWGQRGGLIDRMRQSPDKTMFARYPGWCKRCKQRIMENDPIALQPLKPGDKPIWVHFECPPIERAKSVKSLPAAEVVRQAVPTREYDEHQQATEAEALAALGDFFAAAPVTVVRVNDEPTWIHACLDNGMDDVELPQSQIACACGATLEEWQRDHPGPSDFQPSSYQQAIFDWIRDGEGNAVVEAVAGSGKTTTLIKALNYVPEAAKVIFVAFNKHIVEELTLKQSKGLIPQHIRICTLHSLGLSNLKRALNKSASRDFIDKTKLDIIMNDFPALQKGRELPIETRMQNIMRRQLVSQLVSLCKGTMINAIVASEDLNELYNLIDHYGIEADEIDDNDLALVHEVILRCALSLESIDFDDMCWLPVQLGLELEQFDFLLVDEAQDLNAVQIELVLRSVLPGGRVLAVGDRHQSLYGFRGADTEAIPRLIEMLHAKTLPLSICYRCPTTHLELAKRIVPEIEARPGAPAGLIANVLPNDVLNIARAGDMILCRTNAPLVPMAFALIRKGIKATVRGRDDCQRLLQLVDKFEARSLPDLTVKMNEYLERESLRLSRAEKWEQLQNLQDRCETIEAVMDECQTVPDLQLKLSTLFNDKVEGVVCSSIHRAKGLQAKRVIILRPDLVPHPLAKKGWQQKQEANAYYVMVTRSQDELLFVEE